MQKIRIGFIGTGLIANVHALGLEQIIAQELFDVSIVAACDINQEKLIDFRDIHGVKKIYADPIQLIDDGDINTIYVCTPTKFHKEYVLKSLKAGKNLFCEKPVAPNLLDVMEITETAKKAPVISQVGFVLRYSPLFEYLKQTYIGDEKLGRMMTILFRDDQSFPIGGRYRSDWRSNLDIAGGGTLIEHSIHDIDLIMGLGGKFKKLYCQRKFFSEYNVEDLAILNFELENGALGSLTSCWHQINRDERLIEIFFEKGWLKVEITPNITIEVQSGHNKPQKLKPTEIQKHLCEEKGIDPTYIDFPFYYEELEFMRSIHDNKPSKTGFESALESHKIIDAAYQSAKTDKIIQL